MNIKSKLSLQFTAIVIAILLFFAGLAYYFSYNSQIGKFRKNLADSAKNTAVLLIDVVEVDSALLKKIQQLTSSWEREEVVLTDSNFRIVYSNRPEYLNDQVMGQNFSSGKISYFTVKEKDGIFYRHKYKGKTYYVYSMAFDNFRHESLADLRGVLAWSIVFSVLLAIYLSYVYSGRAIKPISRLIQSIKAINSSKLNDRLDEGNRQDEIAQLAMTFNEMLTDLEIAFKNQEDFVSNASHELRTPLTIMMMESDYILGREREKDEYKLHIAGLMEDIRKLNALLNSLLELAHLNKEHDIQYSRVRIDELVFNSISQVKEKFQGRKIIPDIVYSEMDADLLIDGNAGLLSIAFNNLIENACKFSDEEVHIKFVISDQQIMISITDNGIGIPTGQINEIFSPFKRASNVKYKSGFGVGLSLVAKILELHKVPLEVVSSENKGTRFNLVFNRSVHTTV